MPKLFQYFFALPWLSGCVLGIYYIANSTILIFVSTLQRWSLCRNAQTCALMAIMKNFESSQDNPPPFPLPEAIGLMMKPFGHILTGVGGLVWWQDLLLNLDGGRGSDGNPPYPSVVCKYPKCEFGEGYWLTEVVGVTCILFIQKGVSQSVT